MANELMAEQVKIDPFCSRFALLDSRGTAIKVSGSLEVMRREQPHETDAKLFIAGLVQRPCQSQGSQAIGAAREI